MPTFERFVAGLSLIGALLLTSCGQGGGPSTAPRPPAPPPYMPVFNETIWNELVFDSNDCPPDGTHLLRGTPCPPLGERTARILDFMPDFFIETEGVDRLSPSSWRGEKTKPTEQEWIEKATQAAIDAAEQLTGRPYTGTISHGPTGELKAGQILVRIGEKDACACAWTGAEIGRVVIGEHCQDDLRFLFLHEFGHSFGFFHTFSVPDPSGAYGIMARAVDTPEYTADELFHAQLAYRTLARDQPYTADPR